MALATQAIVLAKRRALNYTVRPSTQGFLKWFFSFLSQFGGNPDLQIVEFTNLSSAEVVICTDPCKLYALVLIKDTATATFSKATDHAATSSDTAAELVLWQTGIGEQAHFWPTGQAFANGITMQGNTTADAGTGSAADGARGFAIIGAA